MKKYLNFDFLGGMALGIGLVIVSIGLVCVSFNCYYAEDLPKWVVILGRVVGFVGTAFYPYVFTNVLRDYVEQVEEREEEERCSE